MPALMSWNEPLFKGISANFDETVETLHSPSFLASSVDEADYYAQSNAARQEDADPRTVTYEPSRPLRLLAFGSQETVSDILKECPGLTNPSARGLGEYAAANGYDGIALDGNESQWHIFLVNAEVLRHVQTVRHCEPAEHFTARSP